MQLQHLATARSFAPSLQAVPSDPLEPLGVVRSFQRDQEICAEGEAANYCYRVITGAVRLVLLLQCYRAGKAREIRLVAYGVFRTLERMGELRPQFGPEVTS